MSSGFASFIGCDTWITMIEMLWWCRKKQTKIDDKLMHTSVTAIYLNALTKSSWAIMIVAKWNSDNPVHSNLVFWLFVFSFVQLHLPD